MNKPLMTIYEKMRCLETLEDVMSERLRQRELMAAGKFFLEGTEDIVLPPRTGPNQFSKLAVLAEEFGEVSRCVAESIDKPLDRKHLREELIQVAAVAVAWAESL